MKTERISRANTLEELSARVSAAIDDPAAKVFQVLGQFGIGKRRAVRAMLAARGIVPVEHDYTIIETAVPLERKAPERPDAVHLWDDVFRTNVMHPDVLGFFQRIDRGETAFNGTFLLVASNAEFSGYELPPFPGVHVQVDVVATLRDNRSVTQ